MKTMTASYSDIMQEMDSSDNATLYLMEAFDLTTAVLVYDEETDNEQVYVLTDMQGAYPTTMDEIPDYDWMLADDII